MQFRRRTRADVIVAQARNHIEKFVIDKGHGVDRRRPEYGYHLRITTFDEAGYEENGSILAWLKGSDNLVDLSGKGFFAIKINIKYYNVWIKELDPVFVILYDARNGKAYRVYLRAYFNEHPTRRPTENAERFTLRVSRANLLTGDTIDYMRDRKAAILARWATKKINHLD
jgi:Domain of unknown function (DUF4365)